MELHPQPTEKAENSEIHWNGVSQRFGISGAQEKLQLELVADSARDDAERQPEDAELHLKAEIANRRLELFRCDHDNAGAFKFNRFGREMRNLFETGDLKLNKEGMVVAANEKLAERRLLVVNMGELDRFNKEGGHKAGDEALTATAHEIETAVLQALGGRKDYRMYRYSGNEFMVDFPNLDEETFERVREAVEAARPSVEGISEAAPLTVDSMTVTEAVDIMNAMFKASEAVPALRSERDANRELVEVIKRLGDFRLEVDKFQNRAQRLRDKLTPPSGQEALSGEQHEQVRVFYENFMGKMFQGTALDSLGAIEELMAKGDQAWVTEVEKEAFNSARRRFAVEQDKVNVRDAVIEASLKARLEGPSFRDNHSLQDGESPLAVVPESTRGHAVMDGLRLQYEAMPEGLTKEKARLDWLIEVASRDQGTGLHDRGNYYKDTERMLKGEGGAVVFVDMAFLKYFDSKGGRAVGDAALKVAASVLEQAIERAGVSGEAYRYGGDEFTIRLDGGDEDVKKVLDEVRRLRDEVGRIPNTGRSDATYAPTKLSFNYGTCDRSLMERVYADLRQASYYDAERLADPREELNAKAELLTIIADKSIEGEKSLDRFQMLIGELRSDSYRDDAARRAQVDTLIVFSKKAIFLELGGEEDLRRLAADRDLTGERLDDEIRKVVVEKSVAVEAAEGRRRDLMDQLIELHVHIRRLEARLSDQEHENEVLRARLRQVEGERLKLLGLRSDIDTAE